jgi:F0F1-type ATP synthase assembly protein I
MPVRGAQAQAPAANFVKAAAAGAAAVTTAAPAMAEPVQQVVAVAEADIFQTALTMVGAVLVGLVIGFAFLFTEDQASSE